jgi:hypothetical protein
MAALAALILPIALSGAVAQAGTIKLEKPDYWANGGDGGWSATSIGGGEFRVIEFDGRSVRSMGANAALPGSLFQTFCVEFNQHVVPGRTYNWDLGTGVVDGGVSGHDPIGGNYDPLDARSAYLYTQFHRGVLSNYHYDLTQLPPNDDRVDSAKALQLALWRLEGELTGSLLAAYTTGNGAVYQQARAWVEEANKWVAGFDDATGHHQWSGLGQVRVLNLWYLDGRGNRVNAQDQLIMIPLPPAVWIGLGLLGGFAALEVRRRRRHTAL